MTDTPDTDRLDEVRRVMDGAEEIDPGPPPAAPDAPDGEELPRTPHPEEQDLPEVEGARQPLNDLGNAHRLRIYHGADLMHVPRVGWHCWDGTRWKVDPDAIAVRRRGQELGALIEEEIAHIALSDWQRRALQELGTMREVMDRLSLQPDRSPEDEAQLVEARAKVQRGEGVKRWLSGIKKEMRTFAKTTGNSDRIRKALLEAEVLLTARFDDLDADPLAINCLSGTLKVTTTKVDAAAVSDVTLHPHDRGDRITKRLEVAHDPAARAPRFEAFLERIQPEATMRRFLQRSFGLALTAQTLQRIWFFYGHGANGKSVLVDTMARIMGDYAATAKIESLTGQSKRGGADATPDLVPLMNARMVRASEPEQGERLREGTIKELTGGEPILVRALHSDFVEVHPRFKLFLSGNHKPQIMGTDDGIWRRLLLVPFDVQIPEDERDQDLGAKLWQERAGILNWLLDGLIDYLDGGLQVPAQVASATQEYREASDPIGTFLANGCIVTGAADDWITTGDLRDAFNAWQRAEAGTEWRGRKFALDMAALAGRWRHPETGKTFTAGKRSNKGYSGIRLTEEAARLARGDRSGGRAGEVQDDF